MYFNKSELRKVWETNPFGFDDTGDSFIRDEGKSNKCAFGAIGSKKPPPSSIIFSWASDYINIGGSIAPDTPPGVVPTYPTNKITTKPLTSPFGYSNNDILIQERYLASYDILQQKLRKNFQEDKFQDYRSKMNWIYPTIPPRFQRKLSENSDISDSSGYTTMSNSPPLPKTTAPKTPKISPHRQSAARDMKEFSERYFSPESMRPDLVFRPRTGKYFKKFPDPV